MFFSYTRSPSISKTYNMLVYIIYYKCIKRINLVVYTYNIRCIELLYLCISTAIRYNRCHIGCWFITFYNPWHLIKKKKNENGKKQPKPWERETHTNPILLLTRPSRLSRLYKFHSRVLSGADISLYFYRLYIYTEAAATANRQRVGVAGSPRLHCTHVSHHRCRYTDGRLYLCVHICLCWMCFSKKIHFSSTWTDDLFFLSGTPGRSCSVDRYH